MKITWRGFADKHRNLDFLAAILFGIYIAAVLWITLFSRLGAGYRGFLFPFQSYVEIAKGKTGFLVQDIENILLFIPLGIFIGTVGRWKLKRAAIIGFCASLSIELLQAVFALGTFECDDLLHNTVGTILGFLIIESICCRVGRIQISRKSIVIAFVCLALFVSIPFGYLEIHHQHMIELASLHDGEDGNSNLLVLNGKNGYAWKTEVYVLHLDNGSLHIKGSSDRQSWWPVSDIILDAGTYVGTGVDDSMNGLLGIELAYYDEDMEKYRVLAPDIGINPAVEFTLTKPTKVRAYVRVYPDFDGECVVSPVIYKIGD